MLSQNEMSFHESMKQPNHWTLSVKFALMWCLKSRILVFGYFLTHNLLNDSFDYEEYKIVVCVCVVNFIRFRDFKC